MYSFKNCLHNLYFEYEEKKFQKVAAHGIVIDLMRSDRNRSCSRRLERGLYSTSRKTYGKGQLRRWAVGRLVGLPKLGAPWSKLPAGGSHSSNKLRIQPQSRRQPSPFSTAHKPHQAIADHRRSFKSPILDSALSKFTRCSPCPRSPRCVATSDGDGDAPSARADQVTTGAHRQAHRRCPSCHPLVCCVKVLMTLRNQNADDETAATCPWSCTLV